MRQTDYVLRPENQKLTLRVILLLAPVFLFYPLVYIVQHTLLPGLSYDAINSSAAFQVWLIGAPYLYFAFLGYHYFERISLRNGFISYGLFGFRKLPLSRLVEVAGDEGDIRNDFNESLVLRFDNDEVIVMPVRSYDEQELRTFISVLKNARPDCNYTYSDVIPFESRGLIRFLLSANESSSLTVRLSKTPTEDAILQLLKAHEKTFWIMYFFVWCMALGAFALFCYQYNAEWLVRPGLGLNFGTSQRTTQIAELLSAAESAPTPNLWSVFSLRMALFGNLALDYISGEALVGMSSVWLIASASIFILIPMFRAYSPTFVFIDPKSIGMRMSFLYWESIILVNLEKHGPMADPLEGTLVLIDGANNRLDIELVKVPDIQARHKILRLVDRYAVHAKFNDEFMRTTNTLFDIQFTDMWLDDKGTTSEASKDGEQPSSLADGVYRIDRLLGYGGQGVTYLADTGGRTVDGGAEVPAGQVVIKELVLPNYADVRIMQDATSRFERGARLLSQLNHPQVVRLLDSFVEKGKAYLVMEYVQGQTLRDVIERHGPFSPAQVKSFGLQMCDILGFLHDRESPVIHCDFAPDNLILTPSGRIKLLDFDVARVVDSTAHTFIAGRPSYTPPEQFRGKPTTRSDIFAMGAILHFLLEGEDPPPLCAGATDSDTAHGDSEKALLRELIKNCCTFEEVERPASAREVAARLGSSDWQSCAADSAGSEGSDSESADPHVIDLTDIRIYVGSKVKEAE